MNFGVIHNILAGIYIHIPFCKQACTYCNFHFSTTLATKAEMVHAIIKELTIRKHELNAVNTIYFGGGTPSILEVGEIKSILNAVYDNYSVDASPEITLEANPDDLSKDKLHTLKEAGINRLSIGVQSFHDDELKFMSRAHNASQSRICLENALQAGFTNITIDLIYGLPNQSTQKWSENLAIVADYGIPHLSAYALTVEPKTLLADLVKKLQILPAPDELVEKHFYALAQWAAAHNYNWYEISNLCKPGFNARHNSSYWENEPYLGVGPSAHSYNGNDIRQWNIANNALYLKKLNSGEQYYETEILTHEDRFNEFVMTSLRTHKGFSFEEINAKFGQKYSDDTLQMCQGFLAKGLMEEENSRIKLTLPGRLLADHIMSELFILNEDE